MPTEEPTAVPTEEPTAVPTEEPTAEPTAEPHVNIHSSADEIKKLQKRLLEIGYLTAEDQLTGTLDEATLLAIAQFQTEYNAAEGGSLSIVNSDPQKAVVDYYTLCALYGVEP